MGLDALRSERRLRRRIGFVAHAPGLYPALSAVENLDFFCTLHGVSRARVAEVLSVVGLSEVARRPAGQLSRGMQQRWRSPAAILHEPKAPGPDERMPASVSDGADC